MPPLTLERIEARPVWAALLRGRLEISTLVVRNAVVPEPAVAAIAASLQKARRTAPAPAQGGRRPRAWPSCRGARCWSR